MSDYIERELALRIIIQKQKELCPLGTYGKKYVDGYDREKFDDWQEIIDGIESVPAADVAEMKHGKWLNFYNDFSAAECSECADMFEVSPDEEPKKEFFEAFKEFYHYCPNCGAKMDLED